MWATDSTGRENRSLSAAYGDRCESCKPAEGIADKELSALLRRERLVPVVHGTTYDELEQVSLLLASKAGLNTAEESMAEVATKIAELVAT